MADLPPSQLPQDPEYWGELAGKIREDAAAPLAAYAGAEDGRIDDGRVDDGWYRILARRAPWLLAASAAAMLILWLALPERGTSPAFRWIADALAPSETAGTWIGGAAPPSVDALMVHFSPALDEEEQR